MCDKRKMLHDARRVWESAQRSIVEQVPVSEDLDAWRLRAARAPPTTRVAAFVAGCALRLAKVDALPPDDPAAAIRPTTQKEALQLVRAAARGWNQGACVEWNNVAYAVCFDTDEEVMIDEAFLAVCADYDADCVLRQCVQDAVAGAMPGRVDADRLAALLAWGERMTKNASDDVYALLRESTAWTFLTPEAERKGQGAPTAKLGTWDPERAAEAHAAPPQPGARILFLFDYTMRQMLDIPFLSMFFTCDYASDKVLAKIETFGRERLRNPPPIVVHSLGRWYLLHKGPSGPGVDRMEYYEDGAQAVLAWMECVMDKRAGALFLGKRLNELFQEVTTVPRETGGVLRARTQEIE